MTIEEILPNKYRCSPSDTPYLRLSFKSKKKANYVIAVFSKALINQINSDDCRLCKVSFDNEENKIIFQLFKEEEVSDPKSLFKITKEDNSNAKVCFSMRKFPENMDGVRKKFNFSFNNNVVIAHLASLRLT